MEKEQKDQYRRGTTSHSRLFVHGLQSPPLSHTGVDMFLESQSTLLEHAVQTPLIQIGVAPLQSVEVVHEFPVW
jgi:hypothetical protein